MKIVHIVFSLTVGGAEHMLIDIINHQAISRPVILIVINNVVDPVIKGKISKKVKTYFLNRKPGERINLIFLLKLWYLMFLNKIIAIHCHNHNLIQMLPFWQSISCLTVHDVNYPVANMRKYKRVFAISNAVQTDLIVRANIVPKLVYNGINVSDILSRKARINKSPFRLVQISRLDHEKKGQHIVLKALNILVHTNGHKDITVDFIGSGQSLHFLKDLAAELNVDRYVRFRGNLDRSYIYSNLKNYSLLLQPSLYEGFGLTVVEAMAARIPVLVSNIEGPLEIIAEGKYGYYFEKGDVVACAYAIEGIIHRCTHKEFQVNLDSALRYVNETFAVKQTAEKYLQEYTKLNFKSAL
ncbi:glycosyltransferase [Pontibacter populi]|uniref:Glycosyltransferase n=1 Tax=Pontibacter populi TaxID=890055 RepID=A0ABV1RX57_9BACT